MRDWPPCPPIQRGGGRRSRPGANPFISVLTVARCPAIFPGVWPQLRDTLSTSQSVGRRTGAFIYALSAVENRPALAAPRHTSTALFSCRFKCPCPPRRQRHFHGNADRAYNTLHFASKVVCQRAFRRSLDSSRQGTGKWGALRRTGCICHLALKTARRFYLTIRGICTIIAMR